MKPTENDNSVWKYNLLWLAGEAAKHAYCPYSKFHVGAVVSVKGHPGGCNVFSGGNVENASYGLTCCAERSAIFAAVQGGFLKPGELEAVAIAFPDLEGQTVPLGMRMPCGACRQVIAEFAAGDHIPIFIDGVEQNFTLGELLPNAFRLH